MVALKTYVKHIENIEISMASLKKPFKHVENVYISMVSLTFRFHFETVDIGIVLSLNADHKIQGMFMDDSVKTNHINTVRLIPINENEFFINGHQNDEAQETQETVDTKNSPTKTVKPAQTRTVKITATPAHIFLSKGDQKLGETPITLKIATSDTWNLTASQKQYLTREIEQESYSPSLE